MDPRTVQFLIFALFNVAALLAGYFCRKSGRLPESVSRPIHFYTVVWLWSPAALLVLWKLPPTSDSAWLLLLQPMMMAAPALLVIPLAKLIGCGRPQIGTLAVASGLSNTGFTMGGYICYCVLTPGDEAMAYSMALTSVMHIAMVPLIYPIARYYGESDSKGSVWRLIVASFIDFRATLLYAAATGAMLSYLRVPRPEWLYHWYVFDLLIYLGAGGAYFGIGLRLRMGHSLVPYRLQHGVLAVMRFALVPLITVAVLLLIHRTPWPLSALARKVVFIGAFMPAATLTVILANLFHLDTKLASAAWVWNTVLFIVFVLPVIMFLTMS